MGSCSNANTKIPGLCEHVWFIITNLKYFLSLGTFFVLGDKLKLHYENKQKIYNIVKMSEKSVSPEIMCQACVYLLSILRSISNAYLFM